MADDVDSDLLQQHMLYNSNHKVLICRPCGYAIRPNGVEKHLRRVHGKTIPLSVGRALIRYADTLPLAAIENVAIPDPESPPVEGLSLMDGYQCDVCRHVCAKEDSMEKHCTRNHGWKRAQGSRWQQRKVHTFFKSDKKKYFVVTPIVEQPGPESSGATLDDCIKALLNKVESIDVEEDKQLGIVDANQHMVDKSPWIRRTGWLREFAGKDMATIVKKSWRLTKDEEGLQLIWRSVGRVLDTCVDGVTDCVERNWRLISFWLNGSEAGKADSKPFNIDNDRTTIKRYKESWQRLICYCIRALGEEEECGIQFLPDQDEILSELRDMAESNEEDEEAIDALVLKVSALLIKGWKLISSL
jgi:hypothetical protein